MIKNLILGSLKGWSIYRLLMEEELKFVLPTLSGKVLDLAGGKNPSYRRLVSNNCELIAGDIREDALNIKKVDFNQELPFSDNYFDTILFINALYIVKDRRKLLREIRRVLKPDGRLVLVSPFIANEMPEPDDFCRLTAQGIERDLAANGFKIKIIKRFGERFSSIAYLLHSYFLANPIRLIFNILAIILDGLIPKKIKTLHPTPLGYFCIASKQYKQN